MGVACTNSNIYMWEILCTWNNTRDLLQNTLAEVNKLSAGGNNDARAMENQTAGATQPHL